MSKRKQNIIFLVLLLLVAIVFILNVFLGSVIINYKEIFRALFQPDSDIAVYNILWNFRLPKAISAIIIGAGLSVSGLLMQSLFRNPLAGPYVMGISSGASLGVAIFVLVGGAGLFGTVFYSYGIAFFAFIGAIIVMLGILLVAIRIKETVSLLIIGIMFASISGALVSILQYFSEASALKQFLIWTLGSLSNISWTQLQIMSIVVVVSLVIAFALQKSLNTLSLSENYAKTLGVSVNKLRLIIIIITSLMAGTITAFAGPIVFIGVAIPHLARGLFKTTNHNTLIKASILIGALILLICDIISQLPGSYNVIPINSISSIFGAPIIIWIIVKNKRLHSPGY